MASDQRMSGSAIDRLGDRLRDSGTIAEVDFAALQGLRREYDDALATARERIQIALPDLRPTSRLKTVQTLVSKLKREPAMQLSRVQDVAGIRVVRAMTLEEQDRLCGQLVGLFGGARVVDRRAQPSFGYRAIHVVVNVDGRLIEIQVRTLLQDRWAQIVERLADQWGRQIRYGLPSNPSGALVGGLSRQAVVDMARRLSPLIAQCERAPGVHVRRIQLSSDAFCEAVDRLLGQFAQLRITNEDHP